MEEIFAIAMVMRRFRLKLPADFEALPDQELILRPYNGMSVILERRV